MAKILLGILLSILSFSENANAQNDVWIFGSSAGLLFKDDTVRTVISNLFAEAGDASISDPNSGQLLLHTDGLSIFQRNLDTLENGTGLRGGGQYERSPQSALIVPSPRSRDEYYVFTIGTLGATFPFVQTGLNYSIVELGSDGSTGKLVVKNSPVFRETAYALSAIRHKNGRDAWILCQSVAGDIIYSFLLTADGLCKTPIVSRGGLMRVACFGLLRPALDGSKLLLTSGATKEEQDNFIQLFNFNSSTGVASFDTVIFNPGIPYWGSIHDATFSASGKIIYFTMGLDYSSGRSSLWQFPLSYRDSVKAPILMRLVQPNSEHWYSAIHIGADSAVYVPQYYANFVARIEKPELVFPYCQLRDTALMLSPDQKQVNARTSVQNILLQSLDYSREPSEFDIQPISCGSGCYQLTASNSSSDVDWEISGDTSLTLSGKDIIFCPNKGRYVVVMKTRSDTTSRSFWPMGPAPGLFTPQPSDVTLTKDSTARLSVRFLVTLPESLNKLKINSMTMYLSPSNLLQVSSAGRMGLDSNGWGSDRRGSPTRVTLAIADTLPRPFKSIFEFGTLDVRIKNSNFASTTLDIDWIELNTDSGLYYLCQGEDRILARVTNVNMGVKYNSLVENCNERQVLDLLGRTVLSIGPGVEVERAITGLPSSLYFVGCPEFGYRKYVR